MIGGLNLANGSKDTKRRELDFYPTPEKGTLALLAVESFGPKIWEPACGDGAMSKVISAAGYDVLSTDIRTDTGFGHGGIDFLKTTKCPVDAIITNPPFNLSPQFITHCVELGVPTFALMLKSQYWHTAERTALFTTHPPSVIYALNFRLDFLAAEKLRAGKKQGGSTMEVIWCVWRVGEHDTRYRILQKP
jgi:hypothetical protein